VFLVEARAPLNPEQFALTFQVADVQASFEEIRRRGAKFTHAPAKVFWGYGAELRDPDGYLIRLWDPKSMQEKG
jgi:predicted enzyme related to lactoylglutathione lyase